MLYNSYVYTDRVAHPLLDWTGVERISRKTLGMYWLTLAHQPNRLSPAELTAGPLAEQPSVSAQITTYAQVGNLHLASIQVLLAAFLRFPKHPPVQPTQSENTVGSKDPIMDTGL